VLVNCDVVREADAAAEALDRFDGYYRLGSRRARGSSHYRYDRIVRQRGARGVTCRHFAYDGQLAPGSGNVNGEPVHHRPVERRVVAVGHDALGQDRTQRAREWDFDGAQRRGGAQHEPQGTIRVYVFQRICLGVRQWVRASTPAGGQGLVRTSLADRCELPC